MLHPWSLLRLFVLMSLTPKFIVEVFMLDLEPF